MSRPPISSPLPQSGPSSYGQLQQQQQQQQSQPSYQGHHPASSYDHLGGMPRSVSSTSHMSAAAAAGPSRAAPNVLDSNITRLLVTTKQLLQGLEHWASGQISEEDVSDIYVRLGNGFEQCVTSFHRVGIQTKELDSIPNDLRICLEQALAETASQETLNVFLPSIRDIIFSLLHGLKQKQAQYKRLLQERSDRMDVSGANGGYGAATGSSSPLPSGAAALPASDRSASPRPVFSPPAGSTTFAPLPSLPAAAAASAPMAIPSPTGGRSGHSPFGGRAMLPETSSDSRLSARSGTSVGSTSALSERAHSPAQGSLHSSTPTKVGGPPSATALAERSQQRTGAPARPAPPDAFRPPRRATDGPRRSESPALASAELPPPGPPRVQLSDTGPVVAPALSSPAVITPPAAAAAPPPRPQRASRSSTDSRDSFGNPKAISRFSADSDLTNGSPIKSPVSRSPPMGITRLTEEPTSARLPPPGSAASLHAAVAAPTLPTLNLPSSLSLEDTSLPSPTSEMAQAVPPESRATLAALQRSDALERRASKRFSSYTFNKMLPSSPIGQKKGSSARDSPQRPSRRDRPPPMPTLPDGMARREALNDAVQEEEEEEEEDADQSRPGPSTARDAGLAAGARLQAISQDHGPQSATTTGGSPTGSVRVLKTPEPEDVSASPDSRDASAAAAGMDKTPRPAHPPGASSSAQLPDSASTFDPDSPSKLNVYLQFGRQVKKATVDMSITLSTLRLMFMERFEYDPGMDDFPDVYIRDHATGVQYELEDMDDLKEGCMLCLNIEPLDQVKQHFDHTFATLMNEIKEMKKSLDHSRRLSLHPSPAAPSPAHLAVAAAAGSSPLARQMSNTTPVTKAEPTSPSPRPAGRTNLPLTASKEAELRLQADELQNLRRDLAIMRQTHVDFLAETKDSFNKLRVQNNNMKEIVKTKMGGSRAILDHSKAKLERLCEDTIQAVEEVSDVIDGARLDAYKRFVTPSKQQMRTIQADLKKAQELVESFTRDVSGVETNWRATWQMELSRVMEEQKLLSHQTKLAVDLTSDIKDAAEMFATVSEFVDQRARSGGLGGGGGGPGGGGMGFRPPSPDEAGSGSGGINNLLMEIRTKEADPHQRLRAIEAQQKAREREKANKTDEFSNELGEFVKGRKLKKTGGAEEAERMSRRRQELALKRMLTGGGATGAATGSDSGSPSSMTPQTTGASTKSGTTTASTVTNVTTPAPSSAAPPAADGSAASQENSENAKGGGEDSAGSKPARGSGSWEGV